MYPVATRMARLLAVLGLLLTGCAPAAPASPTAAPAAKPTEAAKPAAKPSGKDDVTVGMGASIITLDLHMDTNNQFSTMLLHMTETLTTQSPEIKLVGRLAESWHVVDPQTWEFKLRPNVKFHDGSPFTAQVAKFNFDWVLDPANKANAHRAFINDIIETQAVDELTLRLKTKAPSGTLPSRIQQVGMHSMKAFQELGPEKFGLAPVGTGPYKFVEFVRDDHLTVEAWDGYWGTKPSIRKVTFRFIPEDATRVAALQAGTIDLAVNIPPDVAETFENDKNYRVERVHTLRNQFVNMNTKNPPFDKVKVRQAMNYAVDKQAIIKNVLQGNATVTPAVCSPELVFGCPKDLKPYPYDPNKAKQLLAEAGLPGGFETTFWNTQGRYLASVDIGQAIIGYLDKVGIKAKTEMREWGVFQTSFTGGQMPSLFYLGYGNNFADVDGMFGAHLHSARRALYWNTPETDAKMAAELAELDQAKREKLGEEIVREVYDQAPWIFLWDIHDLHVAKANLAWKARPDEKILMAEAKWN